MKKSIFKMVLSLILIFLTIEAKAQQNFTVSLKMPPPGTLNVSDFWNVTVTNNSGSDQSGYLTGTSKEDKDGMIAKGTTVPILFKKGVNNIKIKDLPKTPDVEYMASDPRYKESLVRQGKFPSGKYEICVKVISSSSNEELGSDCINKEVIETGLLSLISPDNGQEIDAKSPVTFTWSSGGKVPEGGFTLKIVELKGEQSPESAMKSNKAFFEQKELRSTTFTYPNSARGFEEGKKYSWMVKSGVVGSEIQMFIKKPYVYLESEIFLVSPGNNEIVKNNRSIKFEWKGKPPKEGFTLCIFEIDDTQFNSIANGKENQLNIEKPLYEKSGIKGNRFIISDTAIKFNASKHYGWGIRSGRRSLRWGPSWNNVQYIGLQTFNILRPFFVSEGTCVDDYDSFQCSPSGYNNGISIVFQPNDGELSRDCKIVKVPRSNYVPSHGTWIINPTYQFLDATARINYMNNNLNHIFTIPAYDLSYPNQLTFFETGSLGSDGVSYSNQWTSYYNSSTGTYGKYVYQMDYWYIIEVDCPGSGSGKTYLLHD